jgi:hypothetical protein
MRKIWVRSEVSPLPKICPQDVPDSEREHGGHKEGSEHCGLLLFQTTSLQNAIDAFGFAKSDE